MSLSYTGIATGQVAQAAQLLQVLNVLTGVDVTQVVTFGNTLVVKGSSANALSVGVSGTTNPAFNVVTNVASAITGLQVTGQASGSGVLMAATGSANESMLLQGVGSGIVQTTATTASATVAAFKAINSNASAVGMAVMLSNLAANNAANAAELGFSMNNSTPAEKQFGAIRVTSTTVTASSEQGTLIFRTMDAGTMTTHVTVNNLGVQLSVAAGVNTAPPAQGLQVRGAGTVSTMVQQWDVFSGVTAQLRAGSDGIPDFGTTSNHGLNIMTNGARVALFTAAGQAIFGNVAGSGGDSSALTLGYGAAGAWSSWRKTNATAAEFQVGVDGTSGFLATLSSYGIQIRPNNVAVATFSAGGGLQMGSPTGGDKGSGTINVSSNIYLNGTAYTNPHGGFEAAFTGKVERFAARMEAMGMPDWTHMSMDAMEAYTREHMHFPGFADEDERGLFDGGERVLLMLEWLTAHCFGFDKRLRELEAA